MPNVMRLCLTGAALLALSPSLAGHAASATDPKEEQMVITGSYIKRDNFNSSSPVSVIDALDIQSAGTTNTADIIFNQTQNLGTEVVANPGASGPTASSGRTGGSGQGGIGLANLRGLGPRATMNLMDGHRLVFGDANFIYPQIAIQRIEILLDGASALYGSEAIAGAVNYIPLKNYDGFKLQVERKDVLKSSAPDDKISLLAGMDGEKSNFLFALDWRDRERLEQSEFPKYLRASKPNNLSVNNGFPGAAFLPRRNATGAITSSTLAAANQLRDPGCGFDFQNPGTDPTVLGHDRWGIPSPNGRACGMNFSDVLDWNSNLNQLLGYARFDYEFSDIVSFNADVMFGRQKFDTRSNNSPVVLNDPLQVPGDLAGNPYRAFTDVNFNGVLDAGERLLYARDTCNFVNCTAGDGFPDRDINGDGIADPSVQGRWGTPVLLPSATADADGDGIPDRFDPDSGVAFNEDVTLNNWTPFGKNLQGLPSAVNHDGTIPRKRNTDNVRLSAGLTVEIPDTTWEVNATGVYGRREQVYALAFGSVANFSTPQLQASFFCVNPADIAAGRCQQFNPFSTSQFPVVNRVPQAQLTPSTATEFNTKREVDAIFVFNDDRVESSQRIIDLVTTGELYDLPAGPLAMAAGYSFRREDLIVDVNNLNATSTNTFGTAVQPQDAFRTANDVFIEFRVPVIDYDWSGPLELQLAARYTDNTAEAKQGLATDAEFDDTVRKVAMLWQPRDWVSIRASWGEGFVVPELGDLFQGRRDANRQGADPTCTVILPIELTGDNCNIGTSAGNRVNLANSQLEAIQGNPNLAPESSDAVNVGFTLSLLDGDLTIQADYVTVNYDDVIFQLRAATVEQVEIGRFATFYLGACGPEPTSAAAATPQQIACALQARNDWILNGEETDRYSRDLDIATNQPIGFINTVRADFVNLLAQEVRALDTMVRYRFDASGLPWIGGEYGGFEAKLESTYMMKYTYQIDPLSPEIKGEGNRNDTGAGSQIPPIPEWRVNASLSWLYGGHYARVTGRYHSEVDDLNADGTVRAANSRGKIEGITYIDAFYSYTWQGLIADSGDTQFSLGIQNILGADPLPIEDSGGLDTNLDSPFKQVWTARVSHEF